MISIFTLNATTGRYIEEISSNEEIIAEPHLTLSNNEQTLTITNMLPRTRKNI